MAQDPALERRRLGTLIGGTIVALASGTNYVFSAYAPQLATRLRITHTQLNIVALAGNVGVYFSGPVWGRIADRRGPQLLMICGFIMLLVGYSGIRFFYNSGDGVTSLSSFWVAILAGCSFLTGWGGNAGLTGSMNANANSQPDKRRATTNGIVISGFGLSAFFFSTLARVFFKGDTSSLLLLLALGTSLPMVMGYFLVRVVPHAEEHGHPGPDYTALASEASEATDPVHTVKRDNSRTRLLRNSSEDDLEGVRDSLELSGTRSNGPVSPAAVDLDVDVYGKRLIKTSDFWLLTTILFLLSGTGLMYINNVGSMTQALLAHENPTFDELEGLQRQGNQVSVISVCNFSGRILMGMLADVFKHRFGWPRCFGITLVAFIFVVSQLIAANVDDIDHLWKASASLGLAYGMMFGLYPTVVIEWFGLSHFSENWGIVSVAPAFGGNLFSLAFGRNLDAHDPTLNHTTAAPSLKYLFQRALDGDDEIRHRCLEGKLCYVDTLRFTTFGCTFALCMAIYAGWRDWKRRKAVVATL